MSPTAPPRAGRLELTALSGVRIRGTVDEGLMTTVYRGLFEGREIALKVFRARYVRRHAARHPTGIAAFEHERNRAFYDAPGLREHVAAPVGFIETDGVCAVLQELLHGVRYDAYWTARAARTGREPVELFEQIRGVVERAHAAGLFDMDLHPGNVLVVDGEDGPTIKLFDFNRIPFHERPRNPAEWLGLRLGLVDRRSRDLRKLRLFRSPSPPEPKAGD